MPTVPGCKIGWSASFEFDFRAQSGSNFRGHRMALATKVKREREALYFAWVAASKPRPPYLPVTVRFTRLAPRLLDEGDNLSSAFKGMRDELACLIGLRGDGANAGAVWSYAQERRPLIYRVRVELHCEGSNVL